ncbi:MAG: AAA family ATPase [Candidatus Omnitrophica bacterium]|nr:AAA family ATPase [Candidatus Omnitrophota bacterium]
MYFKKLELVGFKSFFDKTTLNFEPGITAVVGPNGCGKSNIFDAIRWVLGEQSVKSLRGSEMLDVIFNGTDAKEPLGMAEVSLTFDNDKKYFAVDHHEVVITRRLFRSGESEYLLNKTPVRLKDITELLMGTGIGAENYSLIEQGKIGQILSSKPEDRRMIFDEAAGITRYKSQKREALRKLEETEQNLLRVNDIVTEVKRQIGSLERQANKARRYKEVFEELKTKEIIFAAIEQNEITLQKDNIIHQLKELEAAESVLLSAICGHEEKMNAHRAELKAMEEQIMAIKNRILGLDNLVLANEGRINFNKEKTLGLEESQQYLRGQIDQTKNRLLMDEEKLTALKNEHGNINKNIEIKKALIDEKEALLSSLGASIKSSLENIAKTKRDILEMATKVAQAKNDLADFSGKEQVHLARKKRLEIERLKVGEEKSQTEQSLEALRAELEGLEKVFADLNLKIGDVKKEQESESANLEGINAQISDLEKEKLSLQSHKEFLEKLRTKYEDISESMNAVVQLDRPCADKSSGLVIKVLNIEDSGIKLSGEAKPIDLDAVRITEKLSKIEDQIGSLESARKASSGRIEELNGRVSALSAESRNHEIALSNKKNSRDSIQEQFNKICEEEEIIGIELSEVSQELDSLKEKMSSLQSRLLGLEEEQKSYDELISFEQGSIDSRNKEKEQTLVMITQAKTELEGLNKRLEADLDTLKILEDTYRQDKASLGNIENQIRDNDVKKGLLAEETRSLEDKISQSRIDVEKEKESLAETEAKYRQVSLGVGDAIKKTESDRKELDSLKARLYELQMQNKDADFSLVSIKERILQSYKTDLGSTAAATEGQDKTALAQEIEKLKERLDSCGTVNLVAIEEYDELKKRYDFLNQQQSDLAAAKESVHEAILKINRTTKKMFLETFEKVRVEFRNYFKLLFNGGDAQIFLLDENDPLESGVEIICRPPGKKLQNVLLLSGGEKSMSAIALIFAIFKVKPSPFCVLDEIDAALDEANVDRFSRMLTDFVKESQFIVITHNKKTIANAGVMYGITMQESGVSKIVSVKFGENKTVKDKEPDAAVAGAV